VHVDEEEFVVVLAGSGLSWQDGTAHPIRARDVVWHAADAEAHTLIAGDEGLEVLIFASGSTTGLTRLPRAGIIRVGEGTWPLDADPFAAEPPLDPGTPCAQRPQTFVSLDDVVMRDEGRGVFAGRDGQVFAGALSGLRLDEVGEGRVSCPAHYHTAEDEKFLVLDGSGEVRLGAERHPLRVGSIVVRASNSGVEHALHGGPLTYLAWGTRVPHDSVIYPDSNKVLIGEMMFRADPVDYWDGEA
jgi:uncharacterized cupin superfamily protein